MLQQLPQIHPNVLLTIVSSCFSLLFPPTWKCLRLQRALKWNSANLSELRILLEEIIFSWSEREANAEACTKSSVPIRIWRGREAGFDRRKSEMGTFTNIWVGRSAEVIREIKMPRHLRGFSGFGHIHPDSRHSTRAHIDSDCGVKCLKGLKSTQPCQTTYCFSWI